MTKPWNEWQGFEGIRLRFPQLGRTDIGKYEWKKGHKFRVPYHYQASASFAAAKSEFHSLLLPWEIQMVFL
jgi:hypothetical protein